MPNYISPMQGRVFVQAQPSLTEILNSSGVWNSAGAQFIEVENNAVTLTPNEPKTALNFIHGSPSPLGSILGRKSGAWGLNVPIFPNGTQAVAPDTDLVFQTVFGGPGSLVTGTDFGDAWVYGLSNFTSVPLTILEFSNGQTAVASRYGLGCVGERAAINFNTDILAMSASGPCLAVGDIETFAILDPQAQGGLTAFPVEPNSFSYNGQAVHGYGGTLSYSLNGGSDTVLSAMCTGFTVDITTGLSQPNDLVDSLYPAAVLFGPRAVTGSMTFYNNDASALTNLKQIARLNEAITLKFKLGSVAGQRMGVILNGLQLIVPTITENSNSVTINFGNALASVAPGLSNDIQILFA